MKMADQKPITEPPVENMPMPDFEVARFEFRHAERGEVYWSSHAWEKWPTKTQGQYIIAIPFEQPPAKRERLMTMQECAGKYLVWAHAYNECRWLVTGFNKDLVIFHDSSKCRSDTVQKLHDKGFQIADTPTSEPRSLLIVEGE